MASPPPARTKSFRACASAAEGWTTGDAWPSMIRMKAWNGASVALVAVLMPLTGIPALCTHALADVTVPFEKLQPEREALYVPSVPTLHDSSVAPLQLSSTPL